MPPVEGIAAPTASAVVAPWTIEQATTELDTHLIGTGKSGGTVKTYRSLIQAVAKWAGWNTVRDIESQHVVAFLASRRRNDHKGRAWRDNSCRSLGCAVKALTALCKKRGQLAVDPMLDLEPLRKSEGTHKHPYTVDEARRFILASVTRHERDARRRGFAPLYWLTLFHTGLRNSEASNLRWVQVVLDSELCGLWTDPDAPGNKGGRREWLPLPPKLAELLRWWREQVPRGPTMKVFPFAHTDALWDLTREAAGLPSHDEDSRPLSPHAARASYITWLGQIPSIPERLRKRMARHGRDLTENAYTVRSKAEMAEAAAQLPPLWPDNAGPDTLRSFPHSPENRSDYHSRLDNQNSDVTVSTGDRHDSNLTDNHDSTGAAGHHPAPSRSCLEPENPAGQLTLSPARVEVQSPCLPPRLSVINTSTPSGDREAIIRALTASHLTLARLIDNWPAGQPPTSGGLSDARTNRTA